jgi:hypothetical protein
MDKMSDRPLVRAELLFDWKLPSMTRAYLDCPETAMLREVKEIVFADGGHMSFPRDFLSCNDTESRQEALPKITASLSQYPSE